MSICMDLIHCKFQYQVSHRCLIALITLHDVLFTLPRDIDHRWADATCHHGQATIFASAERRRQLIGSDRRCGRLLRLWWVWNHRWWLWITIWKFEQFLCYQSYKQHSCSRKKNLCDSSAVQQQQQRKISFLLHIHLLSQLRLNGMIILSRSSLRMGSSSDTQSIIFSVYYHLIEDILSAEYIFSRNVYSLMAVAPPTMRRPLSRSTWFELSLFRSGCFSSMLRAIDTERVSYSLNATSCFFAMLPNL